MKEKLQKDELLKEKLQKELFDFAAKRDYLDDSLKDYLFYLSDKLSNTEIQENLRRECLALRERYSIYRSYLDPHYCNPENRGASDNVNFLNSFKNDLLKDVDLSIMNSSNVPHSTILRIKSFTHFTEKLWRDSLPSDNEIQDLVAFGFTLSGITPREYVRNCYLYAILLTDLMEKRDFLLQPAKKPKDTATREQIKSMGIYVPGNEEIPELPPKVLKGLKDYIRHPKRNGYQGLHMVFFNPVMLTYVECQIKTEWMEIHSCFGEANHDIYKDVNATGLIDIDLSQFNNLRGFKANNGKVLVDKIGFDIARKYRI
jgi:hypothetical protein